MKLIVAVAEDWGIGKDNELLAHISPDLKRFKALTTGHAVVMGRKTLESMPGGRPLPGRRNMILSATPDFAPEGAEVYPTVEALLEHAPEDAFVIGGGSVYQTLLPHCDTAYITKIGTIFPADTWFPDLDATPGWETVETGEEQEYEGLPFRYLEYRRVKG